MVSPCIYAGEVNVFCGQDILVAAFIISYLGSRRVLGYIMLYRPVSLLGYNDGLSPE